ncbi:hypothetical protein ABZS93_35170 [Streptomyces sp900116325]|uniref:ATP-binding protein n=1 Tax=Streptomyces sp. 900116325 TaxID=3154295 RepID=UPI0033B6EE5D
MVDAGDPKHSDVSNQINEGFFFHAVIQGRDITIQLPRVIQPALAGLPAKSPAFTGRDSQLRTILSQLKLEIDQRLTTQIHLISGLGGIGKTELAVQAAHSALAEGGHFPGGALFIDLFGYDDERRLLPERALISFLQALGISEEYIPDGVQDKSRLYRSILSAYAENGARLLVVIDNASSAEQVVPLLPSDGSTASIVTSRHTLSFGARIHELAVLDPDASVDALRKILRVSLGPGENRIDADIDSGYELATLCGHLPLALQICAAMLVDTPKRPTSSLVESLRAARSLIESLHREDYAVRAVFDLSYERLPETEKKLLGFISFSPGSDISTAAAARVVDEPEGDTEQLLISLSRAHLVEPGGTWGRWGLHDLVRHYALEKVEEIPGQEDAVVRLLDHYLEHAREASVVLGGSMTGSLFISRDSALEWFDSEYRNLIACIQITAKHAALAGYAAEMPHRLARYLDIRHLLSDWKGVMEISLGLLPEAGYEELKMNALDSLGMACRELYQLNSSVAFHREAIEVARSLGNDEALARFLNNSGNSLFAIRDFEGAAQAHAEAASLFLGQNDSRGFARATDNSATELECVMSA